ncbi:Zn-dependent M28 family amino/carboxypeptidase [Sphingopyxis panaciterrae]|uniref:M28 family peptidase n=1 Tax=Sphingopyxis panaciterrae TaxID=363841 RepID=UPI001423A4BC|nr:M28 family peptidase [Sphingopyxis panaciterrae]NIJ36943.1 Zn-dependent M28 family amino/carboxypeptidase [Sphingopyxis panaciterrae]
MTNTPRAARFLALASSALAFCGAATASPQSAVELAQQGDDPAWAITEGLTTEIGPRQAATEAEAAARRWALARLAAMGFANVREEQFMMPTWVRGDEEASLTGPFQPQKLHIAALGNSASTGPKGIEGEIVYFASYDALLAAPDAMVKGKIVFIDHQMKAAQDGSGYGQYGRARFTGPNAAAKKGAIATVIRSIGTDNHRVPHTGGTNFEKGVKPIPAGALSNPDADQLVRQWRRVTATPVAGGASPGALRLKLLLTPQNLGQQHSGNIIAEVPGSDPAASPVIIACHLDSWDLATGAIDDAAGCGIITAAAKHVMTAGQPRRTIRLLWAGAEEVGVFGGKAYFEAHGKEKHAVAMESDFGADRVWRVDFKLPDSAKSLADRISAAVAPFGVTRGKYPASGGADVGALIEAGVPAVDLQQDGTRYFDLHHTADDTLDKVDPAQLRQNVVAWTAVLAILANSSDAELP